MIEKTCINVDPMPGNEIAPPLDHGRSYVLHRNHICSCGEIHYDVGLKSQVNFVECYKCHETLPDSNEIHWCHSSHFE